MKNKHVLLVEDDQNFAFFVHSALEEQFYTIDKCDNGEDALSAFRETEPNIVLLDINLKGKSNGFDVAHEIRKTHTTPIIFTTSRDHIRDIQRGFEIGNVDYMKKPFDCKELLIRIQLLLHHSEKTGLYVSQLANPRIITIGKSLFYPDELYIKTEKSSIPLRKLESELLEFMYHHIGQTVLKDDIVYHLWKDNCSYSKESSLHNLISQLRKSISKTEELTLTNVYKRGFKLTLK